MSDYGTTLAIFDAEIGPWAQFGLAGLVISALFGVLFWLLRRVLDQFDEVDKRHAKAIKDQQTTNDTAKTTQDDAHRDERKEWREQAEKSNDRVESALRDLTVAIQHLK